MQPRLFLLHSNGLSLEDVQAERVWVMDYGLGGGCLDLGVPYTCRGSAHVSGPCCLRQCWRKQTV